MVWIPGLTSNAVLPPRIQHLLNLGGTLLVCTLGMVARFVGLGPTWPDQSVVKLEKYERHRGKRILHVLLIVKARIIVLGLLYVVVPRWLPDYLLRKVWWWAGFWLTATTWGLQVGALVSVIAYYGWRHRCRIIGSYIAPYFVGLELGMTAIDLDIEWDPLFRQSCIALYRNECESRSAALREIRRRLKRCNNLPVSRIYISIERLVVFTPNKERPREERFLLARRVHATLINEWYPEKARRKSHLQQARDKVAGGARKVKESIHKVAYSRHETKERPHIHRIGSTRLTLASKKEARKAEKEVRDNAAEPPPAEKGDRWMTIKVALHDVVINLVGYDFHFSHTNLMKLIEALVGDEEYPEDYDEEEEGFIVFEKAKVEDLKVNLYGVSHRHTLYDGLVEKMSHHAEEQPKNIELPDTYEFEYEYRPVVPLTLKDVTVASQVFQSKRRLALFLHRVVFKALSSTALDGLDLAVGGASTAVEKVLKTTLGGVDRQASKLGGPFKDVVQGSTGAALNTSVGALEATKSVVDGVTHGAKTITSGVVNGVTRGKASDVAKGLGDGTGDVIDGVDEGTRTAISGVADGTGAVVHGVGAALRYVPIVGKSVGGIVDATGHVVTGTLGVAGGVVGGVLGGVGAAGRGLARGDAKGAAKGAFKEVKGGLGAAGDAVKQAGKDASSSLGRGLRDTMHDGVKAAKILSSTEGQRRALGIAAPREAQPVGDLDDTAGGDEPLPAAITPEAGPGTVAKGAGPSSQKKSGARSIRKAVAKATGMHGTFSGKPKADPVPRRLFPEVDDDSDDGPPLRVPPEVAAAPAPAPPVEEIDDW
mmetsp:Transcript_6646/g.19719  ORF Transcript_6646/g.19719 Transcript_6646/m.19719 type:complete len:823 (-) Transcript_6646:33-2501(-)